MLTDYQVKGVGPDMAKDAFLRVLREASSPIAAIEASAVYDYCAARRSSVAFLLGMIHHESTYGRFGSAAQTHSWGNTRPPAIGADAIGVTERNFSIFRNWIDGGVSTVARWMDYAPYQGKNTVREIIPIWAPPIENSTERYITAVLADIERWVRPQEPSMGHVPKPPINVRLVVPPKSSGVGYDLSATPRKPLGSCTHSMVGTVWGTDGHFRLPNTGGLTDFGIGQVDIGQGYAEILQWCDPFGKVIPWANGEATGIEGQGQRFVNTHGVGQINRGLVSIETEDGGRPVDAQGRPTAPATAAQWSSLVWLTAYIHAEMVRQTAATFDWHMIHKEFATKDCPFPRIYNHLGELRAAIVAVMRHWQEGAAYPAGGVIVNGLRLAVPTDPGAGAGPLDNYRDTALYQLFGGLIGGA